MPDDEIDKRGYRSLPVHGRSTKAAALHARFGDVLFQVPGFVWKQGARGRYPTIAGRAGLLVPCRNAEWQIVALKVRRDDDGADPRYSYLSSTAHGGPSPGAPVHVPAGVAGPLELVRITEGELKADAATVASGILTISVPGVSNWRPAIEVLMALKVKTVRVAFDADARLKPTVAVALRACASTLVAGGFTVELETWPIELGKGIDDLLAGGEIPTVLAGDAATQAIDEIAKAAGVQDGPADRGGVISRLTAVLRDSGASGLFGDESLLKALAQLSVDNPPAFAGTRETLRQAGVKLRDFDKALRKLVRQVRSESPTECPHADTAGFFVSDNCICRTKPTADGPIIVPLANFNATIIDETILDDGVERRIVLGIVGKLADGRAMPRVEVQGESFQRLDWVIPRWGADAIVWPGEFRTLSAAIQVLSKEKNRQTIYTHTGWRRIDDSWVYLHGGGAIGSAGTIPGISVVLPDALAGYCFPEIPSGERLISAVQASLRILDLAVDRISFPLFGTVYRSVLRSADFSDHLAGPTGAFKSELAALAQQHFGPSLDARHLPGSWSSTGNALEGIAFAAKDVLFVVDDFAPTGSTTDVQRMHREADRLLRAQGNNSGRQRMKADGSLRPSKPPRGLILSTGEDIPRGQSLRARLFVLEVSPGDVDGDRLTECQSDARNGLYAQCLAAFIKWLALGYDKIQDGWIEQVSALREQASAGGHHARTPGIVAEVTIGLRLFFRFAVEVGAISAAEEQTLSERGWRAVVAAADLQAAHQAVSEPAQHFLRLIGAVLSSGRAHVADVNGNAPAETPEAWGWRKVTIGTAGNTRDEWQPQGRRIGWVDADNLLLEPDSSFAEAQRLAVDQSESLPVQARTVFKRLREKGLLVSFEEARQRLTIRRTVEGSRKEVLHLQAALILNPNVPTVPPAPIADELGRLGLSETRRGTVEEGTI
ncbi:MAG: DUF3854 domain-containing protein [Planctomycetia bacterium]|nr:DUF3854 domain-containing protein [Planctomycetia bacterium]